MKLCIFFRITRMESLMNGIAQNICNNTKYRFIY